ncbi:putative non-specific serine/threonine protein kinase [Helianthus annuus]|nr:putative non-specific serine/threonine protein kinase [Helianthus annuus]KAJ0448654.1 putative non-specific serine/threonine protein kinase [Helianthus annuus]KAJ0827690.1 putative non-specific serine/threonine protein kinase [Helianthus annuus]
MNLNDAGNLVLFNHQNSVVWQSFYHPTAALLPGQKLFTGHQLKSSVSSTNSSEGIYTLQVTDKGLFIYVESNPPQPYYNRFVYPYDNDTKERKNYIRFLNGSLSLFIHSSEPSGLDIAINIPPASSTRYMKLMLDGHLQVWQSDSFEWTMVSDVTMLDEFEEECDFPLVCQRYIIDV